ncbi:MAG: MlaD family protein [Cyclobacteriaceae bacterium]|nr:MlaD family protein [Cyclobacteriaceae bacterium]
MKYTKEFKVGLFAIIAFTALYFGFNFLKGSDFFSSTKKYYVIYSNIGGLEISNPVKINGVNVGRVSDKKLLQGEKENSVIVELDLGGDIIIGTGATATLESDLLGSMSISLNDGNFSEPINYGDTIKGELQKGLQDLFEDTAKPIANNLEVTISKINAILTNFEGTSLTIKETLESFKKTSNDVDRLIRMNSTELNHTITEFKTLAIVVNKRVDQLGPVLKKYGSLADSLKAIEFSATLSRLNKTLDEFTATISKVKDESGTLGKLMNNDSLYNNLNKTLEDFDKVMIHLEEEPNYFLSPLGKTRKQVEKQRRKEANKKN